MKPPSKPCKAKWPVFVVDGHPYVMGDLEVTADDCYMGDPDPHRQIFEALQAFVKGWY